MGDFKYNKPKSIKIIVESVPDSADGPCEIHYPGQEFTFDFERCPSDFCSSAFHSLFPDLRVLEFGGRHPWDEEVGVTRTACPDPNRPVVFKIVAK